MRDALYNRFLCKQYQLTKIEKWLEVPLDGHVASNLYAEPGGRALPRWDSIRRLTLGVSERYQNVAADAARSRKLIRADLDLLWFRNPYKAPILAATDPADLPAS